MKIATRLSGNPNELLYLKNDSTYQEKDWAQAPFI